METLSSSLELERIKGIMQLYCSALSGSAIEVLDTQELVSKNIGWVDEDSASTDGTKVFLPPVVDHYQNKGENFSWFKVVSTHQVAHLEFGSFEYDFEEPATQFDDRRLDLEKERNEERGQLMAQPEEVAVDRNGQYEAFTSIGRFLQLFDDRKIGLRPLYGFGGLPPRLPHKG